MERVELDLTKLSKIYPKNKNKYNFLFCIIEHFSKYAKKYLTETKESKEILDNLKLYLNEIGKPEIIQSNKEGEFREIL